MNKKIILLIIIILAALAILSVAVFANPAIGFTVNTPTNGSTAYPEILGNLNFSITTNESFNNSCQMMWNNNGTLISMSNMSATNLTWQLNFNITAASRTAINNVTFKCGNTTALKEWMNTSSSAGFLFFYVKNAKYTLIDRVIINNSVLAAEPVLNLSVVSDNATNCTFNFNATGEQSALMTESDRGWWTNATALTWPNSTWNGQHNITYNCTDSAGNYSGSGMYFFKLDTTVPTFTAPTFTLANKSTGGNYLNITANITDQNPGGCKASLYYTSGTIRNTTSSDVSYNASLNNTVCMVNITPADIVEDGKADVAMYSKDLAGNENISANQTYIFYRLKTGWNLITGYENKTVAQIAGEFTNVTYVSLWDNNEKVFWTYTTGGSTNSTMGVNFSSNLSAGAEWVYVNADVVSMRRYYAVPTTWQNVSLFYNTSANLTTWNLIGVTKYLTDLNATMQRDACYNTTYQIPSGFANCSNVTWVSFWSTQENKFCTFYRGRLSTSCSLTADKYNLTSGDALMIAVQANVNMTLDRSKW